MITIQYKGCKIKIEMPDGMPNNPEDNSAYIVISYDDRNGERERQNLSTRITDAHYQFNSDNPRDWQKEVIDFCKEYVDNHA